MILIDNRNIESLTPEIKLFFNYTLKDLFIVLGIWIVLGVCSPLVYQPLQPLYYGFCFFVGLWSIKRNRLNPDKRRYQVILLLLRSDKQTYHMVEEEAILREGLKDLE